MLKPQNQQIESIPKLPKNYQKPNQKSSFKNNQQQDQQSDQHLIMAQEKQKRISSLWTSTDKQLEQFFVSYQVYDGLEVKLKDLINSNSMKLVKNQNRLYFGEVINQKKEGFGNYVLNQVFVYIKIKKFMRVVLKIIKSMDLVIKFILMVMYIQDNFKKIRNMDQELSIGSRQVLKSPQIINQQNIIKDNGGEDFHQEKDYIAEQMVIDFKVILKMVQNMEKDFKFFLIRILTKGNMQMDCLKAMDSITGVMVVILKEILNKELEMDLESGKKIIKKIVKHIVVIIYLIENQVMECIYGKLENIIKDNFFKMYAKDMVNYIIIKSYYIKECGQMENKCLICRSVNQE